MLLVAVFVRIVSLGESKVAIVVALVIVRILNIGGLVVLTRGHGGFFVAFVDLVGLMALLSFNPRLALKLHE